MEITRNTIGSAPGPSEWFTGLVYIDPVAVATWGDHVGDEEYAAAPSLED